MAAQALDKKVTISMPQEMANDLRACVEAGEFSSTSEVIRDAIRVWRRQRLDDAERLAVIRARVRSSLDDPRPNVTSSEARAEIRVLFERAQQAERDAASEG